MNHEAIYALYPQVVKIDDGTGAFNIQGNKVEIDLALVNAWVNPNQYKQDRVKEYPPLPEQLDMLWHAMEQDPTKRLEPFYSSIKDIKDAYPK
jgi:hypothetical protein